MGDVVVDEQGRPEPPLSADEVATLRGFLDFHRATTRWKTAGLSDEQLGRTLAPSTMTLGGLLKHLAYVEDYWCTHVLAGEPMPEPWADVDWQTDPDWEWRSAAGDPGEGLRRLWSERVARSRTVLDGLLTSRQDESLAATHPAWGGRAEVSLRWVLVHLVEEYARHNGHADLLREAVDGQTGE